MLSGAIDDGYVAKGRVLLFRWDGVAPFKEEVFNIVLDGQAKGAVCVVPCEVDAGESGAGSVMGEFIVLEEDVAKVVGVAFSDVLDAEVIDDYAEEDRAPLVAP